LYFSQLEKNGNALFLIAKGQEFPPPDPLPFCPFVFRLAGYKLKRVESSLKN